MLSAIILLSCILVVIHWGLAMNEQSFDGFDVAYDNVRVVYVRLISNQKYYRIVVSRNMKSKEIYVANVYRQTRSMMSLQGEAGQEIVQFVAEDTGPVAQSSSSDGALEKALAYLRSKK